MLLYKILFGPKHLWLDTNSAIIENFIIYK